VGNKGGVKNTILILECIENPWYSACKEIHRELEQLRQLKHQAKSDYDLMKNLTLAQ